MNGENDNNNKSWRVRVDVFRGYMKAKMEGMEQSFHDHCEEHKEVSKSITNIEKYIVKQTAIRNFKSALWSFLGGAFVLGVGILLKIVL